MAQGILTEIHGNGDPLVMVHGLGGTANAFGPQAEVLSRFFRVIRMDLPGSGRTPASGPVSIESLTDCVISVLEQHGAGSPVHVVGHSMGTIVCQHLAVRRPDLVRSLALIGPLAQPPDAARTAVRARAAKAREEGMTGIAEAIVQGGTSAATKAAKPETAAFIRELLTRQDPEGYALTCEALAAAVAAPVEQLTCPSLLITGSEDGTSPAPSVRALAMRIAGSKLVIIPACGHWATLEAPSAVNDALLNFYFTT
ncbi:MAG: alpha/beta hydrolase [Bryobacteraceae bacterium]|nr:alpha/beta hydrolase [Bryobacteraceae bacterium]